IRKSYILCDFPMIKKLGYKDRIRLAFWNCTIVNSKYTQNWVRQYWNKESVVLYPPVAAIPFRTKKTLQLLSIGRFHGGGRSKRQDIIIDAFITLCEYNSENLQLNLAGFVQSEDYLKKLKEKSFGYNVVFHENVDVIEKEKLLATSSIYIHACGYEIDEA